MKERKLDDAEGEIALVPSNFKVLQVTQMGPYNILAALQESCDPPAPASVTNAKEYEAELEMKLGSLSVRVNKLEPPGFKQFDVFFLIRAVPIKPVRNTIII